MSSKKSISKKIILVGSFCVGKTSLISKYVYRKFPVIYQTTLGVKIERKIVDIADVTLKMIIWDIGGEQNQDRIPESYYLGCDGIIYVFDLTRPSSYNNLTGDIDFLKNKNPGVPVVIVGNKKDLLEDDVLKDIISKITPVPSLITSAKTGDNVDEIFNTLALQLL